MQSPAKIDQEDAQDAERGNEEGARPHVPVSCASFSILAPQLQSAFRAATVTQLYSNPI